MRRYLQTYHLRCDSSLDHHIAESDTCVLEHPVEQMYGVALKRDRTTARYIGPKSKIAWKFGGPIFGADKVLSKESYPPGQHGNNCRRKQSKYTLQFRERQMAKYTYGVLEHQFHSLFEKTRHTSSITDEILLQFLESRLDNVIFRLGIALTCAAARQLVSRRHVIVDGEVVNVPFYTLKSRQIVGVRERDKSMEVIVDSPAGYNHGKYPWLEWDARTYGDKYLNIPTREEIPEPVKGQLIVELYLK